MKKEIKIALIVIGVVAVGYLLKVKEAAKNLGYGIGGVRDFSFKKTISWTQEILITNGDVVDVPVNAVAISNYIGQFQVGSSILLQRQVIQAKSTTPLLVKVVIPYSDLVGLGFGVISGIESGRFSLTFRGNLNSLLLNFPIDKTFKIDINKKIK